MSTFVKSTKHPDTGEWDDKAVWVDDYFGRHNYGVHFQDGTIVDSRDRHLETREVPMASVPLDEPEVIEEEAGAHHSTTVKHPDGRQDVKIEVTRLDVGESDEDTEKAKKVIEEDVLPQIQEAMVKVVVIHRYSTASTSQMVPLSKVRHYAEFAVEMFQKDQKEKMRKEDFIVVEVHEGSYLTRVSTLVNV